MKLKFLRVIILTLTVVLGKLENGHAALATTIKTTPLTNKGSSPVSSLSRNNINNKAVVVGGGPVGLATALVLANAPHYYDVKVYESVPDDSAKSTRSFEPTKAYQYLVNPRGQEFTSGFPGIQRRLIERGIAASAVDAIFVPSDIEEKLPESIKLSFGNTRQRKKTKNGITDKNYEENEEEDIPKLSYWIPRHEMVNILHEEIHDHMMRRLEEENNDGENASGSSHRRTGSIQCYSGTKCVSIGPCNIENGPMGASEAVMVTLKNGTTGEEDQEVAKLVVGADGMNSEVRDCLANGQAKFGAWPQFRAKNFSIKSWISPSSGLRLKSLQFPPRFTIPDADRSLYITKGKEQYVIRSKNTGGLDYASIGFLPMRDDEAIRPGNFITRPNHELWKLTNGESVRAWCEKSFPRMNFQKVNGIVSEEEWERFAKAEGLRYPPCQYSPGLEASSEDGECGVVLVGDAVHAFPPDIGQGINAGLGDVVALDRALKGVDLQTGLTKEKNGTNSELPPKLGSALKEYQRVRGAEIKSLIRLARFGAPYQYRQPLLLDRVGRKLWLANVTLRMLLNKVTCGLIPKQCLFLAQDNNLTFRQVMRRSDITTASLSLVITLVLFRLLSRLFPI